MFELVPFLRTHEYVATYLGLLYILALSFLVFGKGHQGLFNSLFCFGFLLMGWTVIPSVVASDNYWFLTSPPSFVSRFALISIFSFALIDLIKSKLFPSREFFLGALSIIVVLLLTFFYGLLYVNDFDIHIWMAFTLILGVSALMFLYLTLMFSGLDWQEVMGPSVIIILLIISIVVGFIEMANNPFIFNMFRGFSEARSASFFHNPNWFAVYISPLLFYSAYLAVLDLDKYAAAKSFLIVALVTLGLILSGSRSVTTIASIFVFLMLVVSFLLDYLKIAQRLLLVFLLGGSGGVALGYFFSVLFGAVVLQRYSLLIDRIFLWPLYYFNDFSAQQSLQGRLVVDSDQVTDSAYIFALQGNPLLFIVLLGIVFFAVFRLILSIYVRAHFSSIVGNFLLVYLMAIGAVGQVFWAFPVWISFSVFFAFGILLSKNNSLSDSTSSSRL